MPVIRVQRTLVQADHRDRDPLVLRCSAQDQPGHPTADGRDFAALRAGDELDGALVTEADEVAYGREFTYDILPDSDSATYFAGGVLIGSTLAPPWSVLAKSIAHDAPASRAPETAP